MFTVTAAMSVADEQNEFRSPIAVISTFALGIKSRMDVEEKSVKLETSKRTNGGKLWSTLLHATNGAPVLEAEDSILALQPYITGT